jgi:nucleoside phosphorylase
VLAVEMEGRGFLEGVRAHGIEAGVVRGISDLLSGKSKADEHGSQAKQRDVRRSLQCIF